MLPGKQLLWWLLYSCLRLAERNVVTICLFVSILLILFHWHSKASRLPPGPWGLPIVGYLPFLGTSTHDVMYDLAQRYGPIYRLSMGSQMVVVLSDPGLIREAFRREVFAGRPNLSIYDMFDGYGLVNTQGAIWRTQRRFLREKLRSLGMKSIGIGRIHMEAIIMKEVKSLLLALGDHKGESINVEKYFNLISTNVVSSLLMSKRYHMNDPQYKRFMELYPEGLKLFLKTSIALYLPFTKNLKRIKYNCEKLKENRRECNQMFYEVIQGRRKDFSPNKIACILDYYLLEESKALQHGAVLYGGKDFDQQVLQVLCDLFGAGEESVKTFLCWSMIFFIHHPQIVARIQEDLDRVVGRTRLPSLDNLKDLPFLEATIYEILRICNIFPLGTFHATTSSTYLGGYYLPKGANVIPNLYACHMNPKYWKEPHMFDPERFINKEGNVFKPKAFLPFGAGRRMCLGEVLAQSQIFLILASVLHMFNLETPFGKLPSLKGVLGTTLTPEPYKVKFVPREISYIDIISEDILEM